MKWILKGICIAILVAVAALGFGYITMELWNWLMPAIFGLKAITFWQAFGMLILAKILFGGFKGGHRGCPGHRAWRNHNSQWKSRWENKMANMTPEEKEKFMKGMNKCGWGGSWKDECCDTTEVKTEEK